MAVLQDGVLSTVHLAHTALADLSDDFVMANGRTGHSLPPHRALQLCLMLLAEGVKGNGNWRLSWVELGGMGWSGFGALHFWLQKADFDH